MATLNEKQQNVLINIFMTASPSETHGTGYLCVTGGGLKALCEKILDLATPPEPRQGECPKCAELRREIAEKVMQVVFIKEGENQWVNLSEVLKLIEGE